MKTVDILDAIEVLKRASDALVLGNKPIGTQCDIGHECGRVRANLYVALAHEHPEVTVEKVTA